MNIYQQITWIEKRKKQKTAAELKKGLKADRVPLEEKSESAKTKKEQKPGRIWA